MNDVIEALHSGGYLGGISRQRYLDMEKLAANGSALAAIQGKTTGMQTAYFDLFNGVTAYSAGLMDTAKTTAISALAVGDTNLISKVDTSSALTKWFQTGQEITIQDDVNKEYVTVTDGVIVPTDVTYDRSTPTTVVSSAYTTSASARPQVLSNGWIVTAESNGNTNIQIQVSKDGGVSFSNLCIQGNAPSPTLISLNSKGTVVYLLTCFGTSNVNFYAFDATTVVVGGDISGTSANRIQGVSIDTSQTSLGACSLAINSTGTELHASWSSKNSTYPNSFNIRYAKGTINADGSVTWGGASQLTVSNASGTDQTSPCITVLQNGQPSIAYVLNSSGAYSIYSRTYNGSSWVASQIYNGGTYVQSSLDAIVTSDGVIHVVWKGTNATDTPSVYSYYSKSTDGGVTWSAIIKVSYGSVNYCSLTANDANNIYVVSHSGGYIRYSNSSDGGVTWNAVTNIINPSLNPINGLSVMYNVSVPFTSPVIIYGDTGSVKFRGIFTITTQVPHLTTTPLVNAYKTNALIYRSLGQVDTVAKKLKFSQGFKSVATYDRSTPTTVVASAYDTSGNGGRRLVRLDNGWLVAVINTDTTAYSLRVSYDNGLNWTSFGSSSALTNLTNISIIAIPNTTKVAIVYGISNSTVRCYVYDVNTLSLLSYPNIDTSQTAVGNCSLAIDTNGKLWATWSSKNATYPNSFNIRVSSSTDGGATWSSPIQASSFNTSGDDAINPCIVIYNNLPRILFTEVYTSGNYVRCLYTTNGTTFPNMYVVYSGTTYTQSNPSAVVDGNGVIHVVWQGLDATDTTYENLRYSKSSDGGVTWSAMLKLTTGNLYYSRYPTITFDKNNNLYVLFHGRTVSSPTYAQIRKIVYSSSSWGTVVDLTNVTTAHAMYPSTCSNYQNFTDPLCVYQDLQSSSIKFRGVWQETSYTPLLSEDVRYNIDPPTGTNQIVSWIQYDVDANFSIDSKVSLVASGSAESYGTPTKTTKVITTNVTNEDQYVYSASSNPNVNQKITMTRQNTSTDKFITQLLGAVG